MCIGLLKSQKEWMMMFSALKLKWELGNKVGTQKTIPVSILFPCSQCYMYICIYKAYFRPILPCILVYIAYIREFSGNMGTHEK